MVDTGFSAHKVEGIKLLSGIQFVGAEDHLVAVIEFKYRFSAGTIGIAD